ncbi:uncharacterized protein LOC125056273 [Pieris napi]|uniref:uncharacterized protein LOC125056273 n=1 Tax=Pieris napi TaxID=78633 RepID=UPI001FB98D78|nr:uncharacterized protein LOC125056273 [Pieris napi]
MSQECVSVFFDEMDHEFESLSIDTIELFNVCDEIERNDLNHPFYDQRMMVLCDEFDGKLVDQMGRGTKRKAAVDINSADIKRIKSGSNMDLSRSSQEQSTSNEGNNFNMKFCCICNRNVSKKYFANHLRSNAHKNNVNKKQHSIKPNVKIIETAFGNRIITYRVTSENQNDLQFETPELFLASVKDTIFTIINKSIEDHTILKINFILYGDFVQETKNINNTFDFQSMNFIVCIGDDLNIFYTTLTKSLINYINSFERKDSGWSLKKILHLDMNLNQFNPLRGKSFIELPHDIKIKKAVINVKNTDDACFKWALLSALFPIHKNSDRVSSYTKYSHKLKFGNIKFPVKLKDIHKIESLNNISINVFGLEYNEQRKKHCIVGPLYFTKNKMQTHINLLYLTQGKIGHYCYIKNMSRLISSQVSKSKEAIYLCDFCLQYFSTSERLNNHQKNDCRHICTQIPSVDKNKKNWWGDIVSENKLSFDKFQRKLMLPFVIYADFEAFLSPLASCSNDPSKSHTINVQKHNVYSFGYYIKCSYDDKLSKYVTYTGENCALKFMETLKDNLTTIVKKIGFQKVANKISPIQQDIVSKSIHCYICNKILCGNSMIYHDWFTGEFVGVIHKVCSEKFRVPYTIPVFLHNLSHYDAHFIVHALNFDEGQVEVLPQNKEKYISFSKVLKINNSNVTLRFVDSLKFLPSSLDTLAKNLTKNNFNELSKCFPNSEDFKRLTKKGVFPYEFIKDFDTLNYNQLPDLPHFYSSLTDSIISNEDYNHAKDVWNHFNCKNMLDYSNLYLKTDVLLLADIFENFRRVCIKTYDLDPAHYYTAPGLSWDAMLKHTKTEIELLSDIDMIAFIKSGIRGGVSQCSTRYAKANNVYMSDYNAKDKESFLMYFDANNLYGWAMSQYLPTGGFEWVSADTDFNVSCSSDIGFILEVDLEYPVDLHDKHSDLPLCPENIPVGDAKEIRLIPNLKNKSKYIIHYRNLIQCLKMGLKLLKVYRILKFKQSPWLKNYIDLNTQLRTRANSDFEKDFYKLMNNAVFGKTMENIEKRVNVKLLTHWENRGKVLGAGDLIAQPHFHSVSIFSDSLVAIQLNKMKLIYNKPIYLGFCILDISKTLMYDFHYNYMKEKFTSNLKLLYTDTDSLIYQIFTSNFYNDIKPDICTHFDTSDYNPNNVFNFPQVNKKKLGYFKDENCGKIFTEFVGLRSKMYALQVDDKIITKAKGVNKCVTKKLTLDNYKSCLFNKNVQHCKMYRFRSLKHTIFTQEINKVCLSFNDTKRYILPNKIDTLPMGHYQINSM